MEDFEAMVKKVAMAYVEKQGLNTKEADIAGNAYIDAVDDVMEGVYYMLRTLGEVDVNIWVTKKGHEVAAKLYAGN